MNVRRKISGLFAYQYIYFIQYIYCIQYMYCTAAVMYSDSRIKKIIKNLV